MLNNNAYKQLFSFTEKYSSWSSYEVDFSEICEDIRLLSGAQYVAFNLYIPSKGITKTIGLAGVSKNLKKLTNLFGFEVLGKEWEIDGLFKNTVKANKFTKHGLLSEVSPKHIPTLLAKTINSIFNIGSIYSIGILSRDVPYADIVLVADKNKNIENIKELELLSSFLGALFKRLKVEEVLSETQNKLELITKHSPDLLTIINKHLQVTYINKTLPGFDMERVIGNSVLNYVFPQNHAEYLEAIKVAFAGNETTIEIKAVGANKEYKHYKVTFCPIELSGNRQVFISATDITETKLVLEELRISQNNLARTNKAAHVGYWVLDLKTMEYTGSDVLKEMLELDDNKISAEQLINLINLNYRDELKWHHVNAIEKGENYKVTLLAQTAKGKTIWLRSIGEVEKRDGKVIKIKGALLDISEHYELLGEQKKLATELFQFQKVINDSSLISYTDLKGVILFANENFCKLSKYSTEELIGKKHDIVNSGYHNKKFWKNMWATIRKGNIWREEVCNKAKDGSLYWVDSFVTAINDENGKPYIYYSVRNDITKRKKQELEIIRLNEKTNHVLNAINDIVYAVDLETYTPLYNNDDGTKFMGYTLDDYIKDPYLWKKTRHPEEQHLIESEFKDLLEKGYQEIESRHITKQGKIVYVLNRIWIKESAVDGKKVVTGILSNITTRKQEEAKLINEKERMQSIIEATNVGTWEWNVQSGEFIVNERWANMLGYTLEEISPYDVYTWINLVEPNDFKESDTIMRMCLSKEKDTYEYEYRMKHKSGEWIWIKSIGKVILWSSEGKAVKMYGTHTDITLEKESDQVLLKTFDDLHETQKIAQIGRWELDLDTGKSSISKIFYDLLGFVNDATIPPSFLNILNVIHPFDRQEVKDKIETAIKNLSAFDGVYRLIGNKGKIIWLSLKGNVELDLNNRPYKIVGIGNDVTKIKNAELILKQRNKRQKLISTISAELLSSSAKNYDEKICIALENIFNYFKAYKVFITKKVREGNNFFIEHIYTNKGIVNLQNMELSLNSEKHKDIIESLTNKGYSEVKSKHPLFNIIKNDDQLYNEESPKSTLIFSLLNAQNIISGFITVSVDLSNKKWDDSDIKLLKLIANMVSNAQIKKQLEANLIQKTEEAVSANKSKSEFLANISHEIRTPLNAIIGYSELMKDKIHEGKLKEYLKGITHSGDSLLSLINDILDLSKIEANQLKVLVKPVSVYELLNEINEIFKMAAETKQVNLHFNYQMTKGIYVYSDEIRLRQILLNLVGNAIKFTNPNGDVTIEAECTRNMEEDGGYNFKVKVCDTGIGIDKNQFEQIFEAFKQQEGQSTRKYGGTGLGLTITNKLVNLLEGTINVDSELGKGSTFTVLFNHIKIPTRDEISAAQETSLTTNDYTYFNEEKILIVEDNELNQKVISEMLSEHNLQTIVKSSGQQALHYLAENSVDLVLMDIMMPEMNGYETTANIRKMLQFNAPPVIAVTATGSIENNNLFNEIVKKPIRKGELLGVIHKSLKLSNKKKYTLTDKYNLRLTHQQNEALLHVYNEARRTKSIDDIKLFSEQMLKLIDINEDVINYAMCLKMCCDNFEMDEMLGLITNVKFEILKSN